MTNANVIEHRLYT